MIATKSAAEISKMRAAGMIVGDALRLAREMAEPGVRLIEICKAMERSIRGAGAYPTFKGYQGFPAAVCMSVNEEVIHGIPSRRKLCQGDLLSIDCGATLDGFVGDSAITVAVGEASAEHLALIDTSRDSLMAGIEAARVGATIGDIGHAIETVITSRGHGIVRQYCGHGIGRQLHEDPQVPNYGEAGTGPIIQSGWCLAIEPMVNLGGEAIMTRSDGWTVVTRDGLPSAHYELAIAIVDSGVEILTLTSGDEYP
jgi:methionyl aminopeptidase